ncbi:MAG: LLM class flavin-dependent oxidoreductase [Dehalococcoidia bacterium]|nr:LLM class flavin-dependent oxidoreductase [Dehalococcoidia bacterium]
MTDGKIGVDARGGDAVATVARIQELEELGIHCAWLTTGSETLDALTLFSAAAMRTKRILLGTCIVPTWLRHPLVTVQQLRVLARVAPGRMRLGVGPSHKSRMEALGIDFKQPLTDLREYVHVVKALLREGAVDFDGSHYRAHVRTNDPIPNVPVMASALQRGSYEFCGAEADGAISWVSPGVYLRDVALPAMKMGAQKAGRPAPPLIAHVPMCVHDNVQEVRAAAREQLSGYPHQPFYARMFAAAGFPEAGETGQWSDRMIDAVVLSGNEERVAARLRELYGWGISEVIVTVLYPGPDRKQTWTRTTGLLGKLSRGRG